MIRFAVACLMPVALLAAACLLGGGWPLAALAWMTLFVALADRVIRVIPPALEHPAAARAGTRLAVTLAAAHLGLLPLGVWAVAAAPWLDGGQRLTLGLALGLFLGQLSHPVAHELIHRRSRRLRRLGVALYVSILFGHHASSHRRVHHVFVASDRDPNSARLGEGVYRFMPRAWAGSFRAGLAAENAARAGRGGGARGPHPYAVYLGGAALWLGLTAALAGGPGVAVLLALAGHAQAQILLADYLQHYGLRRRLRADGRLEPAGPQHSWNAPHAVSGAMMLNAPRHSDHHANPDRGFPALRLDPAAMPVLPLSMPVMAVIALVPPLWRRIMDPRARRWASGVGSGPPEPAPG